MLQSLGGSGASLALAFLLFRRLLPSGRVVSLPLMLSKARKFLGLTRVHCCQRRQGSAGIPFPREYPNSVRTWGQTNSLHFVFVEFHSTGHCICHLTSLSFFCLTLFFPFSCSFWRSGPTLPSPIVVVVIIVGGCPQVGVHDSFLSLHCSFWPHLALPNCGYCYCCRWVSTPTPKHQMFQGTPKYLVWTRPSHNKELKR